MKLIIFSLICLILTGCTTGPLGKILTPCDKDKKPPEINTTGTLMDLGGMLYNDRVVIHVDHWPTKIGQTVYLTTTEGKRISRKIKDIKLVKFDVNLLFLDEPVNFKEHVVYNIIKPSYSEIYVLRLWRPTTTICAKSIKESSVIGDADYKLGQNDINGGTNQIRSGDSGKGWFQYEDGELGLIGLSTKGNKGLAYSLYSLKDDIDKLVKAD